MAKREKDIQKTLVGLLRKYSPGMVVEELGLICEEYSFSSRIEPEIEFWFKCSRACKNLSSGMTKWIHNMIEEIESGEHDDSEGG
jgi:hypothetical protein